MLVWGGCLRLFAHPSAPGMGTHRPFPLPWEARGNVCRGLISDQPLRAIGPETASELAKRVGSLQNPQWNLTSSFCLPHALPHPYCLHCSLSPDWSAMEGLVTLLPVLGISEFWFGLKLIVFTSYSTLSCWLALGSKVLSYLCLCTEKINNWEKVVIWSALSTWVSQFWGTKKLGFKSQPCHFLAGGSWANDITSPWLSFSTC